LGGVDRDLVVERHRPRPRVRGNVEREEGGLAGVNGLRLTRLAVDRDGDGEEFRRLIRDGQAQLEASFATSATSATAGGKQDDGARKGHAGKGMASLPRRRDWACRRHRSSLSILG